MTVVGARQATGVSRPGCAEDVAPISEIRSAVWVGLFAESGLQVVEDDEVGRNGVPSARRLPPADRPNHPHGFEDDRAGGFATVGRRCLPP